jgi:sulfur carrier protein ThiS
VLPGANYSLEFVLPRIYFRFRRPKGVIITVEHSAVLKLVNIQNSGEMEVPEDITISALLMRLGIQEDQHKYLLIYVNGKKGGLSHNLQEGDALQLFLPIGGG